MGEEPPPACRTPIETFTRPTIRRNSTNNYKSELEAYTHHETDSPQRQLERRKSEESTYQRMLPQYHRRQMSHHDDADDAASVISSRNYERMVGQTTDVQPKPSLVPRPHARKHEAAPQERPGDPGRRLSFKFDDYKSHMLRKSLGDNQV
ncbi:hypothetical protein KL921_000338 [Ogataea angusta]|uniref:Uncharacterized protein n=1 Tax=Pichia angusta TaxID=870730 RepID=A0AAN6I980_PICAN|nr:uncharacterized protein KL928_000453 [Ogataea angusta]KAG7814064.1 hypothetical protein KL921_000338 [Ogataea angusta]KAG7821978.1 hypothetical protein KL928_000453 [Ogataea angusta]KAG7825746.1 hypothetical protein KL909_000978 [Ogataea angusta]KAG7837269.1 hypothetical protein KL943_001308 [Ogataea angusta]KAG7842108.1 hypothetical protein KL942_000846 [Ogataea angusta]